jgi:FkbM family methyltransferase
MNGGIESKIGNLIATILSNEKEGEGEGNTEYNKKKFMYDIGMNSGFFGIMGASLGFPVKAFDPQPMCHAYVEKSREANNFPRDLFQTHLMGLGDGGGGSVKPFLEVHVGACHGGYSWPDRWGGKMAKVPMHTLNDAVGSRHIVVMKMDTEGNEASILSTGYDIFEKGQVDYLLVETKPKVWERGIGEDPVLRIAKLAKRIVDISRNVEYTEWKEGKRWRDGDFLFEFVDKPVREMRQVEFRQAAGSSDCQ